MLLKYYKKYFECFFNNYTIEISMQNYFYNLLKKIKYKYQVFFNI